MNACAQGCRSRGRRGAVLRRAATAGVRPGRLRRHVRRRHRRGAGEADGQDGRDRRARQASRRPVERRPGLHRHRQQGGDRRPVARVLSPRLAALSTPGRLEVAEDARNTATKARARRPSTASSARCGSSSRTSPSRCSRSSCAKHKIPVDRDEWLDRAKGVKKDGGRITSITMLSGKTYAGRMFIDATYEGDLMAAAGVDYHVGREAQSTLRREVERRADRRAAPPPPFRRAEDRRSARTSCPAIRRAACCRASAPRRRASTAQATSDAGVLLSLVPDRSSRQPHPVPEAEATTRSSTSCSLRDLSTPAGARRSTSSIRFPTARPTPTTTARSAPTTSASTTTIRRRPTSAAARS